MRISRRTRRCLTISMGCFCACFLGGFWWGFFCHPQLQVGWLLHHILQHDIGTSSIVPAAVIALSNICLKMQFCPGVVQALGAQLVESYSQRIVQS